MAANDAARLVFGTEAVKASGFVIQPNARDDSVLLQFLEIDVNRGQLGFNPLIDLNGVDFLCRQCLVALVDDVEQFQPGQCDVDADVLQDLNRCLMLGMAFSVFFHGMPIRDFLEGLHVV